MTIYRNTNRHPAENISRRTSCGFTIIETLVAVTVLMIAIAGPLVVASRGLTSALVSKDQMIASYLAQESMELIKNRRDNNMATNDDWLNGFGYPNSCQNATQSCDIGGVDTDQVPGINGSADVPNIATCPSGGCPIYYNSATGYNHGGLGSATIFKRYFFLQDKSSGSQQEIQARVIVDWNEGSVPYQIELVSEMVNVQR